MVFSFLVAMIWKSVLIAGAALALAFVVRWRSASERLILLRTGVAMLLALPLIMGFLPALQIVAFAAPEPQVAPYPMIAAIEVPGPSAAAPPVAAASAATIDPAVVAMLVYLAVLAILAARQLAGLAVLHFWTRHARRATSPHWLGLLERLDPGGSGRGPIKLLVSSRVKSPLSWGWFRPVILVDQATLDQPQDAEAILVHEVAHIVRRDWPALMLARLAVILFWFNPLVWLLEREIVQQSEQAADLEAADRIGAAHYAEKLLGWARFRTRLPANSIAASSSALGRRVRNILDGPVGDPHTRGAWATVATLLCVGIATPIAAMQLVAATPEPPTVPAAPLPVVTPAAPTPPRATHLAPTAPVAPIPPAPPAVPSRIDPDHDLDVDVPPVPEIPDIGPIVEDALRDLPRAQTEAARAVDRAEIARSIADAQRAHPWPSYSSAEFEAAMDRMQRSVANIPQIVAHSMAGSAAGMEAGASQMEAQADRLERLGKQFQTDRAFREREIERSQMQGRIVTHDDLIQAGKGMQEGARGMRHGAREMREAANRMRHVGND